MVETQKLEAQPVSALGAQRGVPQARFGRQFKLERGALGTEKSFRLTHPTRLVNALSSARSWNAPFRPSFAK